MGQVVDSGSGHRNLATSALPCSLAFARASAILRDIVFDAMHQPRLPHHAGTPTSDEVLPDSFHTANATHQMIQHLRCRVQKIKKQQQQDKFWATRAGQQFTSYDWFRRSNRVPKPGTQYKYWMIWETPPPSLLSNLCNQNQTLCEARNLHHTQRVDSLFVENAKKEHGHGNSYQTPLEEFDEKTKHRVLCFWRTWMCERPDEVEQQRCANGYRSFTWTAYSVWFSFRAVDVPVSGCQEWKWGLAQGSIFGAHEEAARRGEGFPLRPRTFLLRCGSCTNGSRQLPRSERATTAVKKAERGRDSHAQQW